MTIRPAPPRLQLRDEGIPLHGARGPERTDPGPSAVTLHTSTADPRMSHVPASGDQAPVRLVRTALLGLLGTAAIVLGSLMGGQSFETHLPGSVVLRHARRCCSGRSAPMRRCRPICVARSRLRRTHPPHPGLAGPAALPARAPGLSRQARRPRRRRSGRSPPARPAALQSRRLHLCRARRNGQPPHQPVLLWARACSGPRRSTRWRTRCGRTPSRLTGRPSWPPTACSTRPRATRSWPTCSCCGSWPWPASRLMVAATPTLARSLKRDPAHAVLLGAGSPLVLLSLLGGSPTTTR